MRTQDEIVVYYKQIKRDDVLGFKAEVLLPFLDADHFRQFAKDEADLSDWQTENLSESSILDSMREYMVFAWTKVQDHRGISASRSVQKMACYLWLLSNDDLAAFAENESNYPMYGAPVLSRICEEHGFAIPQHEGVKQMIEGRPCTADCFEGCQL